MRFEVPERILFTGEVERELSEDSLKKIIRAIKREKVQAVWKRIRCLLALILIMLIFLNCRTQALPAEAGF